MSKKRQSDGDAQPAMDLDSAPVAKTSGNRIAISAANIATNETPKPACVLPPTTGPRFQEKHWCTKHMRPMLAVGGTPKGGMATVYGCRVEGCDNKSVSIRDTVQSDNPHICARCRSEGKEVHMESNPSASRGMLPYRVLMQCPVCEWNYPIDMPDAVARIARTDKPKRDIMDAY